MGGGWEGSFLLMDDYKRYKENDEFTSYMSETDYRSTNVFLKMPTHLDTFFSSWLFINSCSQMIVIKTLKANLKKAVTGTLKHLSCPIIYNLSNTFTSKPA